MSAKGPKIIIAPLNWGLGHATRCIPIIEEFSNQGADVVLASDGRSYDLLAEEFPQLDIYRLEPYDITYDREQMTLNIAVQLPKILMAIYKEHKAFMKLVNEQNIKGIVSDNRFGCYHPTVPSIFITHQLNIRVPLKPLEMFTRMVNRRIIDRFTHCWIPDFHGKLNLSGHLSNVEYTNDYEYIGPLSRFKHYSVPKKYDIIVLLSGPEPQRTNLEHIILSQLELLDFKCLIVQGITEEKSIKHQGSIEIHSYMQAEELNEAILASDVVLCRAGYSTIMDLMVLNKRAIMIPTPGQTEQEYLSDLMYRKGWFYTVSQAKLNIWEAMSVVENFTPRMPVGDTIPDIANAVGRFLESIHE